MKRRKYLASAVAVTASTGCLGGIASGNTAYTNKMVSVVNSCGNTTGIIATVEVVDDEITSDSTARVSLTYRNESDQSTKLHIQPDHPAPLHSKPVDEMPALLLLSDIFSPGRSSPSCWKPKEEPAVRPVMTEFRLDPGHSVTMEYNVWASPNQGTDCIQAQRYWFNPPKASFKLRVTK